MDGLSQDTYLNLCDALLNCAPVQSNYDLRAALVAAPLHVWRDQVPDATSPRQRVALLVDYLAHRESSEGVNALLLFTEALLRQTDPADACRSRLATLARVLAQELDGAVPDRIRIELTSEPGPYRGLQPFTSTESAFFYGRDDEVQSLWEMVQVGSFAAVLGDSGSGKSSLVQAGLIPRLQRDGWAVLSLNPGRRPLYNLAAQLAAYSTRKGETTVVDMWEERLMGRADGASTILMTTFAARAGGARLLLFVDQFEELFTLAEDSEERVRFAENLLDLTRAAPGRLALIVSLRLDFLHTCRSLPGWAELLDRHYLQLPVLSGEKLQAAIEEPARQRGARFEKRLVSLMMRDAGDRPGILPLLQVALQELWRRRVGPWLTYQAYDEIGGVGGAINRLADAAFDSLDEVDARLARYILLRLVFLDEEEPDRYTRRRSSWEDLTPAEADRLHCQQVVARLSGQTLRLLTAGESGVELTHERLIFAWERLHGWLRDNRTELLIQQRLAQAARTWERGGRHAGYLYRDLQLAEAVDAVPPGSRNALEAAFLAASWAAEARKREDDRAGRRQRWLLGGLLFLLAASALAYLGYQWNLRALAIRANPLVEFPASEQMLVSSKDTLEPRDILAVALPPFALETYEVSNEQYRLCVRARRCDGPASSYFQDPEAGSLPVTTVSAVDAQRYCRWLNRRLPTELEWVRAAYGEENRRFPWGSQPPTEQQAHLGEWGASGPAPVTAYADGATPQQILNLAGNVWEWTTTSYHHTYPYQPAEAVEWQTAPIPTDELLTARGGSWQTSLRQLHPEDAGQVVFQERVQVNPLSPKDDVGFRCAASVD
jgi:formylglycine-generating enzyme required for sulfatase activity